MSKIAEIVSDPLKMTMPNGISQSGRIRQQCHKLVTDNDAEEILELFAKGVEINCVIGDFIFIKNFEPMKFALDKGLNNPEKPKQ